MAGELREAEPVGGFDPEAILEFGFGRYLRMLGAAWWVVVGGLVFGAIAGFGIALGAGQKYMATATIYLGQPYGGSGEIALQDLQTNPATIGQIVHSFAVDESVGRKCRASPSSFDGGISVQQVASTSVHQNPTVSLSVLAPQPKLAACVTNTLARDVVARLSTYTDLKTAADRAQIAADDHAIRAVQAGLAGGTASAADALVRATLLQQVRLARAVTLRQLLQTRRVESPQLLARARAERVTARTIRGSALVAALIGALLGAIVVIGWYARAAAR